MNNTTDRHCKMTFRISDAQRAELRRRVEQHRQNPQPGKSWEAVKKELQSTKSAHQKRRD